LLAAMQKAQADFTLTFSKLSRIADRPSDDAAFHELFNTAADIEGWLQAWRARLVLDPQTPAERAETMRLANPEFIPRNHRVEAALQAATAGDMQPFNELLGVLQRPYERQPDAAEYTQPAPLSDPKYKTFCGT